MTNLGLEGTMDGTEALVEMPISPVEPMDQVPSETLGEDNMMYFEYSEKDGLWSLRKNGAFASPAFQKFSDLLAYYENKMMASDNLDTSDKLSTEKD